MGIEKCHYKSILLLCLFNRKIILGFPLSSSSLRFLVTCAVCGMDSISLSGPKIQKDSVGYSHNVCATVALAYHADRSPVDQSVSS